MAVNLPTDGRWDLPEIVECHFFRLYHRSITGSSYTLREYYPRRLVQSDDIEAESIRAINIAANVITADKIYAAFTITGKTIQTNVGNPRAVMNGDQFGGFIGYGTADTYDPLTGTGTYQVLWNKNDGKLYAGGGNVILDATGIDVVAGTTSALGYLQSRAYTVRHTDGDVGRIFGNRIAAGERTFGIQGVQGGSTDDVDVYLSAIATAGTTKEGQIRIEASNSARLAGVLVQALATEGAVVVSGDRFTVTPNTTLSGGLNVGTATGAGTGQIKAKGYTNFESLSAESAYTGGTYLQLKNTSASGRDYWLGSTGSASGAGVGRMVLFDNTAGAFRLIMDSSGHITPGAAGTQNLGDASLYWNDISYKTLTDRGCLGWFDAGVELQDGRKVSDIEALRAIGKRTDRDTVYGVPMLDYQTMPKAVYKPAPVAEEDTEIDGKTYKKGEKLGEDGAEMTALFSIMLGAVKELAARIDALEAK